MTRIRIIATPAGEAPERVRNAWIGVTLPVLDGDFGRRGKKRGFGVLSGPKGFIAQLFGIILGKSIPYDGYAVDAIVAVEILAQSNPAAAQWWRENAPHLFISGDTVFLFEAKVCEEVVSESVIDSRASVASATLSCPKCGGQLPFVNWGSSPVKCEYCGTITLLEQGGRKSTSDNVADKY